jgi:hypothetical protein
VAFKSLTVYAEETFANKLTRATERKNFMEDFRRPKLGISERIDLVEFALFC